MALEQQFDSNRKSTPTATKYSENHNSYFGCNICLDIATDPVITLCGHLYCWPCISKWFHVRSASITHPQCPVCKSEISHTTLIPLYGRGQPEPKPEPNLKTSFQSNHTSPRPLACGIRALFHAASQPNPYQQNATVVDGMFGEMVYTGVTGNAHSLYRYPYSYHVMGGSRLTRQEIQVNKSLNRVSVFLLCCFLLCVLLF